MIDFGAIFKALKICSDRPGHYIFHPTQMFKPILRSIYPVLGGSTCENFVVNGKLTKKAPQY